ncbi:unnamed protein product [Bathycoccus prasinos]
MGSHQMMLMMTTTTSVSVDTHANVDCFVNNVTNSETTAASKTCENAQKYKNPLNAVNNNALILDSRIFLVINPKSDFFTPFITGVRAIKYGPNAKNPRANDAPTKNFGCNFGCFSPPPGTSKHAYTIGTTPKLLNKASNSGFT